MVNQKKKRKVAVVVCNGGTRAKTKIDKSAIEGDCAFARENYPEGVLQCSSGCLGFGSCVSVCRFDAVHINDYGVAEVELEKCVGCGLCVKKCPQSVIRLVPPELTIMPRCSNHDKAQDAKAVCEVSCIACRICEKNCPVGAIQVIDNCAVIDDELCISCGMCAVKCPRGTIIDSNGIFTVM
ncbi:MAG: 4Fe-4S binding protein [Lacrimispora sp.]